MEPSEAKVNGDSLGVSQVKISVRLGGETSHDGRDRPLLVDFGEEALFEHGIWIELDRLLSLGLGLGCGGLRVLLPVFSSFFLAGLGSCLLGSLLGSLLELVTRDHLTRRIVEDELDGGLGDLSDVVGHDVG